MRLLLDTHVLLWWSSGARRVKRDAAAAIASSAVVYVSAASAWEAAVKISLGRLRLSDSMAVITEENGFDPLPITFTHAERYATLPGHHGDPFDRMLIAQAQVEGLTLVTHDRSFEPYDVGILWT